jgi:hypothetical protein
VYAKFRDSSGEQHGPIQDDILYDPDPPEVMSVEIIEVVSDRAGLANGQDATVRVTVEDATVRVTVEDANSGVSKIQLSNSPGFESFTEFAAMGETTDLPWMLPPLGEVHVRVADRAGNLSEVSSERVSRWWRTYLPVTLREQ